MYVYACIPNPSQVQAIIINKRKNKDAFNS